MAAPTFQSFALSAPAPERARPRSQSGLLAWLRARYFATPAMALLTGIVGAIVLIALYHIVTWGIVNAVWRSPSDGSACQGVKGACWAVIGEKYRVILFGTFPYDQQWRCGLILALWLGWSGISAMDWLSIGTRLAGWAAIFLLSIGLLAGGWAGLPPVGTDAWGGMPLTLIIFGGTIAGGLPLAVLLALGRRSTWPVIRFLSIATIEIVRGVPLLALLFFASLIMPLFLPPQLTVDKLVRAEIGMIVFFAAYAAEVVRGGLQAIPAGQEEAAKALGLGYWLRMRKVVLPQAIALVVPALFNDIIRAFKNTTFFSILGLFDVLGATKAALQDPSWVRYGTEGYLFVFLLYFLLCSGLSIYGAALEKSLASVRRSAGT